MEKIFLTIFFLFSFFITHGQIDSGMVAKFSFNFGNANDEVGTNNGLVYGAFLTNDRFGNENHAYYFDGIDDYIDIGSDMNIKPIIGSISLWINLTSMSQNGWGYNYSPIILAKNTSNTGSFMEGYCIYLHMSTYQAMTVQTDFPTYNQKYFFSSTLIETDTWSHLVITFDLDTIKMYVDGALENKMYKGFISTFDPSEPVYIGKAHAIVNERWFNGVIDDIRIYERVISAKEVISLYVEPYISLGISENYQAETFNVRNDPSSRTLFFLERTNAIMTDATGKIILLEKNVTEINLSGIAPGIYFVLFKNREGVIFKKYKFFLN